MLVTLMASLVGRADRVYVYIVVEDDSRVPGLLCKYVVATNLLAYEGFILFSRNPLATSHSNTPMFVELSV